MMFNSERASLWRQKVKEFARFYGIVDMEDSRRSAGLS